MAAASGAVFEVGNSFDDGVDVRHGADFDATAASTLEMVDLVLLSRLVCRELPLLGVSITRTLRRITFICYILEIFRMQIWWFLTKDTGLTQESGPRRQAGTGRGQGQE